MRKLQTRVREEQPSVARLQEMFSEVEDKLCETISDGRRLQIAEFLLGLSDDEYTEECNQVAKANRDEVDETLKQERVRKLEEKYAPIIGRLKENWRQ